MSAVGVDHERPGPVAFGGQGQIEQELLAEVAAVELCVARSTAAEYVAEPRRTVELMSLPIRPGMTIPLPGPLHAQRDRIVELADLGFTDVWTAESDGGDGLTPLALASVWEPRLRLGTAILPAYTRAPACMAQSAATMADAAPGRFVLGIGSSSNVIVERWNGVPFQEPYKKVRDMVRFLRDAFTGERIDQQYDTFEIQGFRLGIRPEQPPSILVAALREGMLKMAGRESDGAITNWLAPGDVARVAAAVSEGAGGEDRELVARIFVCPSDNAEVVRAGARRVIAAYMNVPVYAAFQEWLGRGEELAGMWAAWKAGDRKQALAEIPDSVVDDLIVHGTPEDCRARIQQYFDHGVTTSALAILPFDPELAHWDAITSLAPNAG
jgi:probable F420-dependent oxidoreductase